jgi:DNA-binding response OmpR family regulator
MKGTTILIVDDDPISAEVLSSYLRRAGYQVQIAVNSNSAIDSMQVQMPGLVILNSTQPGLKGTDIPRWVKDHGEIPIIIITDKRIDINRASMSETGADEYIVKPFIAQELISKVRSVLLRIINATEPIPDPPLVYQELRIDPTTRLVYQGENEIILTAKEFDMLWLLASNPNKIFTRDQLLERIWGHSDYIDPGTVTVHIRRLREKIEVDPAKPIHIQTVWGLGYKFDPEY